MNHTTSSRLPLWKSHLPNSLQKLMFVAVHCAALELSKSLINLWFNWFINILPHFRIGNYSVALRKICQNTQKYHSKKIRIPTYFMLCGFMENAGWDGDLIHSHFNFHVQNIQNTQYTQNCLIKMVSQCFWLLRFLCFFRVT